MSRVPTVRRLVTLISRFTASERANVAVLFALFLIPVVTFMGAAIDYGRAGRARSSMQRALDATALMLSRDVSQGTITESELPAKAKAYFDSVYTNKDAVGVTITASYKPQTISEQAVVNLSGSGHIESDFMQLAGIRTLSFNASAATAWNHTKLRVAMILDTTNSMNDAGKMAALKPAAANLVDQLTAGAAPGSDDVLVSLVPFSTSVNVGPQYYDAAWLTGWKSSPPRDGAFQLHYDPSSPGSSRTYSSTGFQGWEDPPKALDNRSLLPASWRSYPNLSSVSAGGACPFSFYMSASTTTCSYMSNSSIPSAGALNNTAPSTNFCPNMANYSPLNNGTWTYSYYTFACQATSTNGSNAVTKIPSTGSSAGLVCPGYDFMNVLYYNGCYKAATSSWTPNSHSTWNGCVTDRDQPFDTRNDTPASDATSFPVLQAYGCPSPLKPLSNDFKGVKDQIASMVAGGSTNQGIGLQWGWMTLTTSSPFGPGSPLNAPADNDPNEVYNRAIILLSDGLNTMNRWYGDGNNPSADMDARQQTLCTNIKNAGITIYTIQVNTTNDPQSSVLASCASSPNNFFYLTSASQILSTFNAIGGRLRALRITN